MPNIVPTARYYPRLSEVITVDDLPEFLSFVQNGLDAIFSKIHYKNLQYSKSYRGDSAFYSLDIVSSTKLAIPLPFDLALVLNPDITGGDSTISSFPITLEYQWEILAFLKSFNLEGFSFSIEDFYKVGLQVFRISEGQVLAHILNNFVESDNDTTTKFEQLINDLNDSLNLQTPLVLPANPTIDSVIATIDGHSDINDSVSTVMFGTYILDTDLNIAKTKLQGFFNIVVPDGIETYIKKLITPKAKATLALSAGIEFPRNILKPVQSTGADFPDSTTKSTFVFAEAQLYVDTEAGMGYQLELGGTLFPQFNAIGNTGILLEIDSLKLDLSKNSNIIEADIDGRPNDFVGVYARAISVTLPSRWFHDDAVQGTSSTTLRLGGYDLLVGTGGLSGTIMLETVPSVISDSDPYYFEDKFEFIFPITLFQKNTQTNVVDEVQIFNLQELKGKLFPNTASVSVPNYSFKFPLSLKELPLSSNIVKTFRSITEYQQYINSFPNDNGVDAVPTLWKKIGGDNGFRIGFNSFDISFHQNKVISSNIAGALEIKKFVHPETGLPVQIRVEGHLHDNGDFNLTASTNPDHPYPLELKDILTYDVRTVELGKEGNDFYIGTSGRLKFIGVPLLSSLEAIEINRLRIYSNGSIEIQGGSIQLAKPIVLPLGPVEITVSAVHYGSHQKEYNGEMRKFNYFGFDGGISIDPLGVEIRGDGVKYYYCVDDLPNKPKPYLHIQTLYVDLTIPASSPTVIINGWLSIPEPGTSPEYAGGIKIKIPKAKISGGADMKLAPKYPAFIIDAEIDLPVPIPLGSFAIYGFRGLIGYRYVAEKEAIGLVSGVNTWYEYYKAPTRGINVRKFSGPNQTKKSGTPVSIGAGASLGTSPDNGTVLNIKAMVLLSLPSLFMIDGRASVLSARLGLDDAGEPPFFAFVALGDNSLEFGFGADFKLPKSNGSMFSLYADVQAGFFFNDSSKWYVNFGTKTNPVTARVVSLITLKSFLMLSAKGIEAGARGEFVFNKTYGPVKVAAWAYVEVGGKISFERPQLGSYLAAGVGAEINIRILRLYVSIDILFGAEASKPLLIYGKFRLCVKVKILFIKIRFCGDVEIFWDLDKRVDRDPINPLINATNGLTIRDRDIVKGVNMLTNETFKLAYLTSGEINAGGHDLLPDEVRKHIIPLDTYIDIKSEKGLLPGNNIADIIGGLNNPPERYTDLIPPDAVVRGKTMRQVKHQYVIESISVKSWSGNSWEKYNPYLALYPDDQTGTLGNMKIGQWQKVDGQYNTIRLLATTPFSYTEQGEPGWHIPEQYGVTAGTLFCQGATIEMKYANFLNKPLGHQYYCYDNNNHLFYANNVAFMLLNSADDEFAIVTNETNVFDFGQSLEFPNHNQLEIVLPQSSSEIALKISCIGDGVKVKFYSALIDDNFNQVQFGHPDPSVNSNLPYEVFIPVTELITSIEYKASEHPDWRAITKIVIEPVYPNSEIINNLIEQIAQIEEHNFQIAIGNEIGTPQPTFALEAQLEELRCVKGKNVKQQFMYDAQNNICQVFNDNQQFDSYASWDNTNDSKYEENAFGFKRDDWTIFLIESEYEILEVKLIKGPNSSDNTPLPEYGVSYDGNKAVMEVDYDPAGYLQREAFYFEIISFLPKETCGELNQEICDVYQTIKNIFFGHFQPVYPINFSLYQSFARQIANLLKHKNYFDNNEVFQYSKIVGFFGLISNTQTEETFFNAYYAIEKILDLLNKLGNCVCQCDKTKKYTLLHEVSWLSLEDYEYNINIPSQAAIEADSQATVLGISKYIQPIWRPDTSYIVQFRLKDIVDNGVRVEPYDFIYGFSTAGPVGFFHTHEHATYGDIRLSPTAVLDDTTGIVTNSNGSTSIQGAHPDKYQLTSLRQYIDYQRSYPNADGNLLSAKPMFYGDGENTKVSLYFTKAYASHFFQEWQEYESCNLPLIKSKLKIVIKDPREDVLISNPPSLDNVITSVDIPQTTIEDWIDDAYPLVPFVMNQWINMYNSNECVLTGGDIIKPKSKFITVELKQLKPLKLYTAIVNGVYDLYKDGILGPIPDPSSPGKLIHQDEIREVHKFVFQTSRYKDFFEQVNSCNLMDGEENIRKAIFTVEKSFTQAEANAALMTIHGESISGILSDAEITSLNINYQHPFDRIVEGILKLSPINEAVTTEFNIIKNSNDNKVIAVIIRNPEPFNNPKIPLEKMLDAIEVVTGSKTSPQVIPQYSVLHSKDYSQAIIMHQSLLITGTMYIRFNYKIWDAVINDYSNISSPPIVRGIQIS